VIVTSGSPLHQEFADGVQSWSKAVGAARCDREAERMVHEKRRDAEARSRS